MAKMVFRKLEKFFTFAVILSLTFLFSFAIAGEITSPNATTVNLPDWFWGAVITGVTGGATTYGMMKIKLDWIFAELKRLETNGKSLSERVTQLEITAVRR